MKKLLTIIGGSFFGLEALGISLYLLKLSVSPEAVMAVIPWIVGGFINIAFLVVLISGVFNKK